MFGKKKMNSTAKGNSFEKQSYYHIKQALQQGFLGITPDKCKIYHLNSYYSKDRDNYIKFDISIEVYLFDPNKWSLLFIFECKDYSKSISVDEIEEFYAKVKQVACLNVKAFFVTNSKLQKSASNYAMSKGISIINENTFNVISSNDNAELACAINTSIVGGGIIGFIPIIRFLPFYNRQKINYLSETEQNIIKGMIINTAISINELIENNKQVLERK